MNGYGGYYPMANPSPLNPEPVYSVPSSVPGIPNISNEFPDAFPSEPQVYSDTSPTPYATDTPVLAPDYLADTPTQLPLTGEPGLPTLPDTPTQLPLTGEPGLPTQLPDTPTQLPLTGEPGLPTLPTTFPLTEQTGPVEWFVNAAGDVVEFVGDVAEVIWDTGKFILEHLDVGIGYAGEIGSQKTSKRYYESLAESAELKAKAYARAVDQGLMSQEEAIARGIAAGMDMQIGPDGETVIFGGTAAGSPNYVLYAAIGLAAYYFLK